ncbi:MAG: hypothetical protein E7552_07435 [Ruminococcaceae bacterium]|nr:hypothetical protein [Oscillospiraceae bacterium]
MAKRLLSMIVSLALLLSCISGITLFAAADPTEPFGYFDFSGNRGAIQKSGGVVRPIMANNNENTSDLRGGSAIGSTGLYGYKITREGLGVYFGGALLNDVPDGVGVTYAVEYYIDSAEPLEGDVMLVTDGVNGDKTFADRAVGTKGVVFYSLSADAVDAIQAGENSDTRLRVKALGAGGGKLYVLGVRILSSLYCTAAEADAETVAALHAHMLADGVNTELLNEKEANAFQAGYTGDTACASCKTVLALGEEIPANSDLPTPYAYLETAGGTLSANFGTGPLHASATVLGNTDVVAIGNTGMYGIKLTGDWAGFYLGGNLKKDVPAGQGVVVAIECYATAAGDFLRFVGTSIFPGHDKIGTVTANETSLIFVEFSAEDVAAWGTDVRMGFQRSGAAGDFYIKSVRMIDPQYVDLGKTPANDYYDFGAGKVLCDYYPEITVPDVFGMAYDDSETGYRYFTVSKALATSHAANEPVYIKVYTTEGNENTTIGIGTYQHYKDGGTNHNTVTGAPGYSITVTNGVGGVYIPEVCFTNGLNGRGSFRFSTAAAAKIARIEVYKVKTYCNEAGAIAETKKEMHAEMLRTLTNVVTEGYQAPTLESTGNTGTVSCAACGEVLSQDDVIPQLKPYAQIDFNHADGAVTTSVKSLNGSILTPVQIPGTEFYGMRFVEHNTSFSFALDDFGITEEEILNGEKNLAISVEYYLLSSAGDPRLAFGTAGSKNLALYAGYRNICFDSVCVNPYTAMDVGRLNVATFTVGKNITYHAPSGQFSGMDKITSPVDVETLTMAKALVNGTQVSLLGWLNGMNESKAMYIKSITVHNAADLVPVNEDRGYYYQNFTPVAVDPVYYPQYTVTDSFGISNVQNTEETVSDAEGKTYPKFGFMYLKLGSDLMTADGKPTPVKLVIKAKDGADLTKVLYQYQATLQDGGAAFSGMQTATLTDGYYEGYIADAVFKNGLNNIGSLRLREDLYAKDGENVVAVGGDDFDDILEVQLYDLRENCAEYHDTLFTEENGNLVRVGRVESTTTVPGYSGDLHCVHCDTKVAGGEELPLMEKFAQLDFSDGTAKYTSLKGISTSGDATIAPVQIPETDAYGAKINAHNAGITFSLTPFGITAEDIANGKQIAVTLEYYIPEGLDADARIVFDAGIGSDKVMAFYNQYKGNTWDAAVLNPSSPLTSKQLNVASFLVGRDVNYVTGPGQFTAANKFSEPQTVNTEALANAIVNGENITLRLWRHATVTTPIYIKSITVYDAEEFQVLEQDTSREYINFESNFVASPVYYPQYSVQDSYGLSWRDVEEPAGEDGLEVIYRYFVVTHSKVASDKAKQPVVIRFTLKDESEVTRIAFSYQKGKTPEEGLWGHTDVEVVDGVGEIVLEDAAFTNGLNGGTSFRVWNVDRNPVGRDLAMVEVYAVKDKTALTALLDAVEEDTLYKTADSVKEYMAVVKAAQAVADNAWASEEEIAAAVADLEAKRALLTDCTHDGEKTLVNDKEETCLAEGYSGDMACAECGFIADSDKGAVIPAHETEIRNIKEATCTEEGNLGDTWCLVCDKLCKEGQKIAKIPHTWDDGVVTKPATKDEAGEITKTCTSCKEATTIVEFDFVATLGDVNGDSKVDSTDARLTLQYAVRKIPASELDIDVGDVNGDEKVDSTDARLILQYAVEKIEKFPAEE